MMQSSVSLMVGQALRCSGGGLWATRLPEVSGGFGLCGRTNYVSPRSRKSLWLNRCKVTTVLEEANHLSSRARRERAATASIEASRVLASAFRRRPLTFGNASSTRLRLSEHGGT